VCALCDRITVLRDGAVASCYSREEFSVKTLARDMVGYDVQKTVSERKFIPNDILMSFKDFCVDMPGEEIRGVNFDIYKGEIVGVTSLSGHGKLALGYGVMGFYKTSGEVFYKNKPLVVEDIRGTINRGIYYLPDDRRGSGLLLEHTVAENIVFSGFHIKNMFSKGLTKTLGFFDKRKGLSHIESFIKRFEIKCSSPSQKVIELSGGNQQKVCISRALTMKPDILFVSEPTRGVDIGAKEKILDMLVEINRKYGATMVIASSELDELMRICGRIVVFFEGKLFRILRSDEDEIEFALAISGEKYEN
ncbi:MAG TPA: ATP-binding cassette domain-containing protein, partial [Bacillota bacterium]|nr:ATP-binding cassette domain-containing protein [Bacillota bacterium]